MGMWGGKLKHAVGRERGRRERRGEDKRPQRATKRDKGYI